MNERIALLGFSIECNRFAPTTYEHDFQSRTLFRGPELVDEARAPAPRMLGELPGFVAAMDARGAWQPVPLLLAMAEPNGPVDQDFFDQLMTDWEAGLRSAGPIDGVYCVLHGAGLTIGDDDPEGTILTALRRVLGSDVPIVASFDLHANVAPANVSMLDAYIGYRTNPHMDMRERGAESAEVLCRVMGGLRTHVASVRVPIVAPTVTMLTSATAPNRPYAEVIDLGQSLMTEPAYAGRIVNVSVMGGFPYADTPFNGMTAVVTATDRRSAEAVSTQLARALWQRRDRFFAQLTSLDEAVHLARRAHNQVEPALVFADVADNPGGGGRGNTMYILEAFARAGVKHALVGVIYDAALARQAHALGEGAEFTALFNRESRSEFSRPFEARAVVRNLHPGPVRCRRGIFAGGTVDLGPSAALDLDGITVVVISQRVQCADPAFFEVFGLDIAAARVVVVKSRGHFRSGFDEFFAHEQVIEVDAPGLTSPILENFRWSHLPRPVIPLDADARWPP